MSELEELLNISLEDILSEENLKLKDIRPYIDFETTEDIYKGWGKNVHNDSITITVAENMAFFYKIISFNNETVEFKYRPFQVDEIRTVTHAEPYLLKEHNKRWYLIAFDPEKKEIFPFSLDRITEISKNFKSKEFKIPMEFNPKTYWKDCVGVFKNDKIGPQRVSFELKNGPRYNNQKYLISSPMHSSQKAIHIDNEWMRFEYFIHIGPEVVRQIRQWGLDNLRNIEPKELDEDVRFG
jgi:predicted DNA-binding transcriptional regulator YafY